MTRSRAKRRWLGALGAMALVACPWSHAAEPAAAPSARAEATWDAIPIDEDVNAGKGEAPPRVPAIRPAALASEPPAPPLNTVKSRPPLMDPRVRQAGLVITDSSAATPPGPADIQRALAALQQGKASGSTPRFDPEVTPVGCATCTGQGGSTAPGAAGLSGGGMLPELGIDVGVLKGAGAGDYGINPADNDAGRCAGLDPKSNCVTGWFPGRGKCYPADPDNFVARFVNMIYEAVCCSDPYYDLTGPHWVPAANAGLFIDHARPRSQTRLRMEYGVDLMLPDRSEFFWPGPPLGPNPALSPNPPNPPQGVSSVNYGIISMYTEAAVANGKASVFFNTPYRSVEPDLTPRHANIGDLDTGIRSLLFDAELFQIGFQMRTYIPTGSGMNGLGTEHVTIEPSVLYALKMTCDCYVEGQLAQWIPFGTDYAGGVFMVNHSVNQVLWRLNPDVQLVGCGEMNIWRFQDGLYTNPSTTLPVNSTGGIYASLGPSARLSFCRWLDFAMGMTFAVTNPHWAAQLYRAELRLMY